MSDTSHQRAGPTESILQGMFDKLAQMLDERAIARWIGSQLAAARKAKKKIRIEDIVQDAAEKFGKSDVTIRRAWQRFGPLERQRNPK